MHRELRDLGTVRENDGAGRGILKAYQERAKAEGVDPLAITSAGWGLPISRCWATPSRRQEHHDDKLADPRLGLRPF